MTSPLDYDHKKIVAGILLQRYLASGPAEVERARNQLLQECILPLVRTILWRKLGADIADQGGAQGPREEWAQEVYGKILIALLRQLGRWRSGEAPPPPPDKFWSYVASAAYNACKNAYARTPLPKGASYDASFQIYYLLTRQEGFALWQTAAGLLCGGYSAWKQAGLAEASEALRDDLQRDPEGFALAGLQKRRSGKTLRNCAPRELLLALLDQAGAPLEYSALIAAFDVLARAATPSLREVAVSSSSPQGEDPRDLITALEGHPSVEQTILERALLRQLWEQILRLPVRQRKALLLNLPGADIRLLPEMGVVGFGEIAEALEQTPAELAHLWNSLPLDDQTIALVLETTPPKVKNLRQSAYDTLSWRMRPFRRGALLRLWQEALRLPQPLALVFLLHASETQGVSLLALLVREGYITREGIAENLRLSPEDLKRVWSDLPMRFDQIAALLGQRAPTVVQWYLQACEQLHTHLVVIRGES
ncbi:MAG TPA: hypothetical protein VKU00_11400 [Chthonomonadaceae bacterium]|nr:hypothetical protein [Chthonomonadaceae bacterium]